MKNETNLKLIIDNRTGKKLEIVIPVLNEYKRIKYLKLYYEDNFDIVLLDGGSSDDIINYSKELNLTLFSRIGDSFGENHFVYYCNQLSKSRLTFYMMADEFINIDNLKEIEYKLRYEEYSVDVLKIEWLFCQQHNNKNKFIGFTRGVCSGFAIYDSSNIHDSLNPKSICNKSKDKKILYQLNHFHIRSIEKDYGKYGRYIKLDIENILKTNHKIISFFKRFIKPIISYLMYYIWKENFSFNHRIYKLIELITHSLIAILALIEVTKFLSPEKQQQKYFNMYE